MDVVVLVPRRADHGWRDRLWEFTRAWWLHQHPDWPIFEGESPPGPFNRAAAINAAIRTAREVGPVDVAYIIDADVIAHPPAVIAAGHQAFETDRLVVSHNKRIMLGPKMTNLVLAGRRATWHEPGEEIFTDSVSCCVAVSRRLFDLVGGFDESFVGWGFEDSAFEAVAASHTGPPIFLESELFHLHHDRPEAVVADRPLHDANRQRLAVVRRDHPPKAEPVTVPTAATIPRILHRTVPSQIDPQVEGWWDRFAELHPRWQLLTWRDPIDKAQFPRTSGLWSKCQNGAQLAGLVRLEALVTHGGVYVDSDCEPYRPLDPLLGLQAFAAWEDETTVPDAVMACRAGHPAFEHMLERAIATVRSGRNAYESGPAVSTAVLPGRNDVTLLPPGAFYPYHYLAKNAADTTTAETAPWAFLAHHWHHSWGDPASKKSIAERQRA